MDANARESIQERPVAEVRAGIVRFSNLSGDRGALANLVTAAERWLQKHFVLFGIVCAALYFVASFVIDVERPLWYDEMITRIVAGLPLPRIWTALATGSDGQPFPSYVLNHYSQKLLGDTSFAIRLPETIGFLIFCTSLYFFARRHTGRLYALGAALLPLASGALYYATEARPYAMELGCFGIALLCWQTAADGRRRIVALTCLAVSIAGAISSHYLAVLLLIPLGLGELMRARLRGRLDFPVWIAMVAGLAPLLSALPMLRALHQFAGGYWARPTLRLFLASYSILSPVIPLVIAILAVTLWLGRDVMARPETGRITLPDLTVAAGLLLLPVYQAVLSIYSGAIVPRYVLGVVAGVALLCAFGFQRLSRDYPAAGVVFAMGAFLLFAGKEGYALVNPATRKPIDASATLRATAAEGLPLVITGAHTFLQSNALEPAERSRAWFIASPGESLQATGFDTDDQNLLQLRKWAPIQVVTPADFLPGHRTFLILKDPQYASWLLARLRQEGASIVRDPRDPEHELFRVVRPQQ